MNKAPKLDHEEELSSVDRPDLPSSRPPLRIYYVILGCGLVVALLLWLVQSLV